MGVCPSPIRDKFIYLLFTKVAFDEFKVKANYYRQKLQHQQLELTARLTAGGIWRTTLN